MFCVLIYSELPITENSSKVCKCSWYLVFEERKATMSFGDPLMDLGRARPCARIANTGAARDKAL